MNISNIVICTFVVLDVPWFIIIKTGILQDGNEQNCYEFGVMGEVTEVTLKEGASRHWLSLTGASGYIDCRVVKTHRRTYSTMFACCPVINQSLYTSFAHKPQHENYPKNPFIIISIFSYQKWNENNMTKSYPLKRATSEWKWKEKMNIKSTTTCCFCSRSFLKQRQLTTSVLKLVGTIDETWTCQL